MAITFAATNIIVHFYTYCADIN